MFYLNDVSRDYGALLFEINAASVELITQDDGLVDSHRALRIKSIVVFQMKATVSLGLF